MIHFLDFFGIFLCFFRKDPNNYSLFSHIMFYFSWYISWISLNLLGFFLGMTQTAIYDLVRWCYISLHTLLWIFQDFLLGKNPTTNIYHSVTQYSISFDTFLGFLWIFQEYLLRKTPTTIKLFTENGQQHLMGSKDSCAGVDNICENEEEGVINCLKYLLKIFVKISLTIFVKMRRRVS